MSCVYSDKAYSQLNLLTIWENSVTFVSIAKLKGIDDND